MHVIMLILSIVLILITLTIFLSSKNGPAGTITGILLLLLGLGLISGGVDIKTGQNEISIQSPTVNDTTTIRVEKVDSFTTFNDVIISLIVCLLGVLLILSSMFYFGDTE